MELRILKQELESGPIRQSYKKLIERRKSLEGLLTPLEVVEYLHASGPYERKCVILRELIEEYQSGERWLGKLLVTVFVPAIVKAWLEIRRRAFFLEREEILNQGALLLLEVANSPDILDCPHKITWKIVGRLKSRLRYWVISMERTYLGLRGEGF